jgi:hypothetical protein
MAATRLPEPRLEEPCLSLFCAIAGHKASGKVIRNEGTGFSRCTRCSADLIHAEGRWDTPPVGYRVVWKERHPEPLELTILAPIDPPAEAAEALVAEAPPAEFERSGLDRRTAQSARVLTSLRSVERRRGGDRRTAPPKKQALPSR